MEENFELNIHFGFGRVAVGATTIDTGEKDEHPCMTIEQTKEPAEIGEDLLEKNGIIDESKPMVVMHFYKPESIDVVIRALEECKKHFKKPDGR